MKGLSTTILIVVTAVVILVAALVLLAIFGPGLQPIVDATQQRSICFSQGASVCAINGNVPATWQAKFKVKQPDGSIVDSSCMALTSCNECSCLTMTTPVK